MSERKIGLDGFRYCPECNYSVTPELIKREERKHHWPMAYRCVRCHWQPATRKNEELARIEWDGHTVTAYKALVEKVKDTLNKAGEVWDPHVAHAVVAEAKQAIEDFEKRETSE